MPSSVQEDLTLLYRRLDDDHPAQKRRCREANLFGHTSSVLQSLRATTVELHPSQLDDDDSGEEDGDSTSSASPPPQTFGADDERYRYALDCF